MARFEVGEEVVIKYRNYSRTGINIQRARVHRIMYERWRNLPYPIYYVTSRRYFGLYALDNKDRCKYDRRFPTPRLYKLEEI